MINLVLDYKHGDTTTKADLPKPKNHNPINNNVHTLNIQP
jgi:hypothetical protein